MDCGSKGRGVSADAMWALRRAFLRRRLRLCVCELPWPGGTCWAACEACCGAEEDAGVEVFGVLVVTTFFDERLVGGEDESLEDEDEEDDEDESESESESESDSESELLLEEEDDDPEEEEGDAEAISMTFLFTPARTGGSGFCTGAFPRNNQ
jgi:TATA-binding protein-associated factor Taf7